MSTVVVILVLDVIFMVIVLASNNHDSETGMHLTVYCSIVVVVIPSLTVSIPAPADLMYSLYNNNDTEHLLNLSGSTVMHAHALLLWTPCVHSSRTKLQSCRLLTTDVKNVRLSKAFPFSCSPIEINLPSLCMHVCPFSHALLSSALFF